MAGTVSKGVSAIKSGQIRNFSTEDGLSSNQVNSIVEGQDGTMWFATAGGLDAFSGGHWSSWTGRNGLPSSQVDTLFEDSRRTLWIATSEALAYISSGHLHLPPVLPDALREQILGITEDSHGSLWFATPDHVVRVNRDGLSSGPIERLDSQLYYATDGLLGIGEVHRDRSIVTDSAGHIWLALSSGLAVADPESILSRFTPVGVRISEMSVDGVAEDMHSLRSLAPDPRSITLKYDAAGLSAPKGLEFRYAYRPDVTLMDLQMPGMSGIDAIAAIRRQSPDSRFIVLTTYQGDVQALRALKAGASGYLLKSMLRKVLLDTIRAVHAGRRYIPTEIAADLADHVADDALTEREIEVLRKVAMDNSNKIIANGLNVSEATIKGHMKNILSKLGANDRTHAVIIAMKRGFIDG